MSTLFLSQVSATELAARASPTAPRRSDLPKLDNNLAMHNLVTKEGATSRSRHFERATIFVKYAIMRLMVTCWFVRTQFCVADERCVTAA